MMHCFHNSIYLHYRYKDPPTPSQTTFTHCNTFCFLKNTPLMRFCQCKNYESQSQYIMARETCNDMKHVRWCWKGRTRKRLYQETAQTGVFKHTQYMTDVQLDRPNYFLQSGTKWEFVFLSEIASRTFDLKKMKIMIEYQLVWEFKILCFLESGLSNKFLLFSRGRGRLNHTTIIPHYNK